MLESEDATPVQGVRHLLRGHLVLGDSPIRRCVVARSQVQRSLRVACTCHASFGAQAAEKETRPDGRVLLVAVAAVRPPALPQTRRTRWACGPFGLCPTSNSTFSPPTRRSKSDEDLELVAMEEVFLAVVCGDESEASVRDELLNGTCGHMALLGTPERGTARTHGPFENSKGRPRGASLRLAAE